MLIGIACIVVVFFLGYWIGSESAGRRWSYTMNNTIAQIKATYEAEIKFQEGLRKIK